MAFPQIIIDAADLMNIVDILETYSKEMGREADRLGVELEGLHPDAEIGGPETETYKALHADRADLIIRKRLVDQELWNLTFGEKGARI